MSVTWGGDAEGNFMKMALWALVIYEATVGVASMLAASSTNSTTQTISGLPSVGSLLNSTVGISGGGALDIGVAAGVWFFALR
jgi:hypothetical protein